MITLKRRGHKTKETSFVYEHKVNEENKYNSDKNNRMFCQHRNTTSDKNLAGYKRTQTIVKKANFDSEQSHCQRISTTHKISQTNNAGWTLL
jgi:hypothetical protein